jgi:penicillin-binding protein 1A
MVDLMQGVMNGGTGSRMRFRYNIKAPMGGKTGTTNDNSDGWFVGYTPSLSFGAWVGGDERDIHFSSMAYGQGAASALPVVALFLQKVYANPDLGYDSNEAFKKPDMLSESDWYSEYDVEKEISRDSVPEDVATEDEFFN